MITLNGYARAIGGDGAAALTGGVSGNGGNGNSIQLIAQDGMVDISSDVNASGGGAGGGSANRGSAGAVNITASATLIIGGCVIDAAGLIGGQGVGGTDGAISLTGVQVTVAGTIGTSSYSFNTNPTYSGYSLYAGPNGSISITTGEGRIASTYFQDANYGTATSGDEGQVTINPGLPNIAGGSLPNYTLHSFNDDLVIVEGGVPTVFNGTSMVTPAQLIALVQMSITGSQTLVLNSSGNAISGSFTTAASNVPDRQFHVSGSACRRHGYCYRFFADILVHCHHRRCSRSCLLLPEHSTPPPSLLPQAPRCRFGIRLDPDGKYPDLCQQR